jgi:hypothetical protein
MVICNVKQSGKKGVGHACIDAVVKPGFRSRGLSESSFGRVSPVSPIKSITTNEKKSSPGF